METDAGDGMEQVDIEEMPFVVHYIVPVLTVYSKQKYLKDVENITMKILDTVSSGSYLFLHHLSMLSTGKFYA